MPNASQNIEVIRVVERLEDVLCADAMRYCE